MCLTVVQVRADRIAAAQARLDDGLSVDDLAGAVEGAELVADPSQGCYAEVEPRRRAAGRPPPVPGRGDAGASCSLDDGAGGVTGYAYRLESRRDPVVLGGP